MNTFTYACIVASLLAVSSAAAEEASIRIKTGDLDLSAPAGRATLDQRIREAAQTRCASLVSTGTRTWTRDSCESDVRESLRTAIAEQIARRERYASTSAAARR